jgi:hypothetical protein
MAEPTYLYGYGSRRHIADPDVAPGSKGGRQALCGAWQDTEETTLTTLAHWTSRPAAERSMARLRELPICKHCERKASA